MRLHNNVIWDVGLNGIIMKAEYYKVLNNTIFHTESKFKFGNSISMDSEPEPYNAWRIDAPWLSEQNAHSLVFTNAVGCVRAEYGKSVPMVHRSNLIQNSRDYDLELM